MEDKAVVHIVATQCHPDDEEKFNKWYDEVHIPLLLKFKGLKKVTRYKAAYEPKDYPKYLTIYEFDRRKDFEAYEKSPEFAAARQEMSQTWKARSFEMKWRVQYEALRTWQR